MEVDELIKVINGMLYMSEKVHKDNDWAIDFLNNVKSIITQQQNDIKQLQVDKNELQEELNKWLQEFNF